MKISFQSAKDFHSPAYDIVFHSLPQAFQYTDIKKTGLFGNIQLIKTDFQDCSISLINYKLDEVLTLQIHIDTFVYQLSYILNEQLLVTLSKIHDIEIVLPALPGQLLLIHYTKDYFSKTGNDSSKELLQFFETNIASSGTPVSLTAASFSILQQITNASPANKTFHFHLQKNVAELFPLLWQSVQQEKAATSLSGKEIEMLLKIKEIIAADLSFPHTKFSLSKLVGRDAYSLSKIFKEWYGIPLRQYIHICRMEKARELLKNSDLAIKKITFAVGYKNVSNFSESFKSYYGYSPSHLRESGGFSGNP